MRPEGVMRLEGVMEDQCLIKLAMHSDLSAKDSGETSKKL